MSRSRRAFGSCTSVTAAVPNKPVLDNLLVELDPANVTLNGGTIATFANLNGDPFFGPVTQSDPTKQAVYTANDGNFKGQPSASFSASSYASAMFYQLPDISALAEYEVFVVLKSQYNYPSPSGPSSNYAGLWSFGTSGVPTYYNGYSGSPASPHIYDDFGSNAQNDYGLSTISAVNTPHCYNVQSADSSYIAYQSHIGQVFSSGVNIVDMSTAPLFGKSSSIAWFNGQLAYFAVCAAIQSPTTRAKLYAYLSARFGLTFIP